MTLLEAFKDQLEKGSPITFEDIDIFLLRRMEQDWNENELILERAVLSEKVGKDFKIHYWFNVDGKLLKYTSWASVLTDPRFAKFYEVSTMKVPGSSLPVLQPTKARMTWADQ